MRGAAGVPPPCRPRTSCVIITSELGCGRLDRGVAWTTGAPKGRPGVPVPLRRITHRGDGGGGVPGIVFNLGGPPQMGVWRPVNDAARCLAGREELGGELAPPTVRAWRRAGPGLPKARTWAPAGELERNSAEGLEGAATRGWREHTCCAHCGACGGGVELPALVRGNSVALSGACGVEPPRRGVAQPSPGRVTDTRREVANGEAVALAE